MKKKNLSYLDYVKRGKDLILQMKDIKYDICCLVEEVCEIRIGGHHKTKNIYSMSKFAEDIGMKPHTLRKWMEEHRNVTKKVVRGKPNSKEKLIIREVMKHVNSSTPDREVLEIYTKIEKQSPEDRELIVKIKYAKAMRNFLQDHNLNSLDQDNLYILTDIVEQSYKELKKLRTKKNGKFIKNGTRSQRI